MLKVKSQSWESVLDRYRKTSAARSGKWILPMVNLVEQIYKSDFADKLFPVTSMFQLRISNIPNFTFDQEVLMIDWDHKTGLFDFEYQETPSKLYKRWKKSCGAEDAFSVLVRFLVMKKWFPLSEKTLIDVFGEIKED